MSLSARSIDHCVLKITPMAHCKLNAARLYLSEKKPLIVSYSENKPIATVSNFLRFIKKYSNLESYFIIKNRSLGRMP